MRKVGIENPSKVDIVYCNEDDPALYDGCQCKFVNLNIQRFCHCVFPENGNADPSQPTLNIPEDEDDPTQTCVRLACKHSRFQPPTFAPTPAPTSQPTPLKVVVRVLV